VLLGLLGWLAINLLANEERRIRKTMNRLAAAASIKREDSGIARLTYGDRIAGFFTTNAVLNLEGLGTEVPMIHGRTDLLQAATAARTWLREAEFEVTDLKVSFPDSKRSAKAQAVIVGRINSQTNQFGQRFKILLQKLEGRWLIQELRTVEGLK
jgi:hypothetical protein